MLEAIVSKLSNLKVVDVKGLVELLKSKHENLKKQHSVVVEFIAEKGPSEEVKSKLTKSLEALAQVQVKIEKDIKAAIRKL